MKYAVTAIIAFWGTFIPLTWYGHWFLGLLLGPVAIMVAWLWLHIWEIECVFGDIDDKWRRDS